MYRAEAVRVSDLGLRVKGSGSLGLSLGFGGFGRARVLKASGCPKELGLIKGVFRCL